MAKFLSEEWFTKVEELTKEAGEIEVPAALQELTFNLRVALDDGSHADAHMHAGQFGRGHKDEAPATVSLPAEVAKKVFLEADQQVGMQAFMSGQMQVEGDVTKLMVLQTVQPTDDLQDLMEDILGVTD